MLWKRFVLPGLSQKEGLLSLTHLLDACLANKRVKAFSSKCHAQNLISKHV
jgi:hypothetical protein